VVATPALRRCARRKELGEQFDVAELEDLAAADPRFSIEPSRGWAS
jgi:hypothetical protein